MLDVLVASCPPHRRQAPSLVFSSITHVAIFTALVAAGRATHVVIQEMREDTTLVFLPRLAPVATERLATRQVAVGQRGGGGIGEVLTISENPSARGFQTVIAVGDVPTSILLIDPNARIIDPRDFTGRGVEGGTGWGVVGGVGPADQAPGDPTLREELYEATSEDARFLPAQVLQAPVFKYPVVLRGAGIEGRTLLQFVIDTAGRVEPRSVKVLETTHAAFAESAKEGILEARFEPAHVGARAVRQLTRVPVRFALQATTAG